MNLLFAALAVLAIAPPSRAEPGDERTVTGTIVFEDVDGSRTEPASGSIRVWFSGIGSLDARAPILDGRFTLLVPKNQAYLSLGEIDLDGVACWSTPTWDEGPVPATVDLVARRVRPMTLRFVDADTGVDLRQIRLVRADWKRDETLFGPFDSPFELPLFRESRPSPRGWIGMVEYAVEVPGHETVRIWVDPSEGGTRTWELKPEARLEVRVAGDHPDRADFVLATHLAHSRAQSPTYVIPPDGVVRVGALSAGTWQVWTAREGHVGPDRGEVVEVVLAAGAAKSIGVRLPILDAEAAARSPHRGAIAPELVDMSGTLQIPAGLDRSSFRLVFSAGAGRTAGSVPAELRGSDLAPDPRDDRRLHWFAGRASPGAWIVRIPEIEWWQEFELVRDRRVELFANRPTPKQSVERVSERSKSNDGIAEDAVVAREVEPFSIRVVDGVTGAALGPTDVQVRAPDGPPGTDWKIATWIPDESTWFVRRSIHPPRVEVRKVGDPVHSRTIEILPGLDTTDIVFWPTQFGQLKAYDGDARIAAPEIEDELRPTIEPLGHTGESFWIGYPKWGDNTVRVPLSGPGRYRVTLGENTRYAPHPPIEFEVKIGVPTPDVVFRLTRSTRRQ